MAVRTTGPTIEAPVTLVTNTAVAMRMRICEMAQTIVRKDTLYQWRRTYVRENKSDVCPTLTANMGMGGHNVPLVLTRFGIRKLTPHECFNLQGFPKDFELPKIATTHLYKQAGNSIVVDVMIAIMKEILKVEDFDQEELKWDCLQLIGLLILKKEK